MGTRRGLPKMSSFPDVIPGPLSREEPIFRLNLKPKARCPGREAVVEGKFLQSQLPNESTRM